VVLEFPSDYDTDEMKVHMESIYQELKPVVNEIKQIEYAIKGRIPAIDNVVAQHEEKMVVYSK